MGAAHGQEKAQDLGGLPILPREHPCRAAHRSHPDVITGEQGAWKPASPVREGADGKGPVGVPRWWPTSLGGVGRGDRSLEMATRRLAPTLPIEVGSRRVVWARSMSNPDAGWVVQWARYLLLNLVEGAARAILSGSG